MTIMSLILKDYYWPRTIYETNSRKYAFKLQASEDPVIEKRTVKSQRKQVRQQSPPDAEGTACQVGIVPGCVHSAR
jgi:hypothetical protein